MFCLFYALFHTVFALKRGKHVAKQRGIGHLTQSEEFGNVPCNIYAEQLQIAVEAQGGAIWVESEEGKGAAFKIELGGVLKDENPTPPRNSFSREDFPNSPLEKGQ